MNATRILIKNFNWRMLSMRILVNMLALLFTIAATPHVTFLNPSAVSWFWLALVLALITALVRPVIQFLTLRFIFVTGGLVLVVMNTLLLYLLRWLMPEQFAMDGLLWAIIAGLLLGVSSTILENLFGLTPPIISEKYPEIRQKVKDRQFYRVQNELSRIEAVKKGRAQTLATAKTLVIESSPAVSQLFDRDTYGQSVEAFEDSQDREAFYEQTRALTEEVFPGQVEEPAPEAASGESRENVEPAPISPEKAGPEA